MKLLIYGLNYAPEPIGVGRYTSDVSLYLASLGHSVTVITAIPHYPEWKAATSYRSYHYRSEQQSGIRVLRCPLILRQSMGGIWRAIAPFSFALSSLPVLIWFLLRHRPQVVFCVEPTIFAAPAALLFCAILKVRTVLHVQDLEIDAAFAVGHLKGKALKGLAVSLENFILRRFDRVITISNSMRKHIEAKGVDASRVTVVRNWVDIFALKPSEGPSSYRIEYNWEMTLFIALYAGSIGRKQNLNTVLAAAEILQNRSDILFLIVGDGPAKQNLLQQYGSLANVKFLPPQPEARMRDLLSLANLHLLPQSSGIADLVLPSKLGGMLSSGKPILVTANKGTELFDALNGIAIIVPTEDSGAIAREVASFKDQGLRHPQIGDGQTLVHSMSKQSCLSQIAACCDMREDN